MSQRLDIVNAARSYLGVDEYNPRFMEILDIYNSHYPLARGYQIQPWDEWCDAFVSAMAIKAGVAHLTGTEVGCDRHIEIFENYEIWDEDGTSIPKPGDIILYNWDWANQPNDGSSDHIGIVESVNGDYSLTIIEGNMHSRVDRRTIPIGWGYIRGYARPNYNDYDEAPNPKLLCDVASEVIMGYWGNGDERKRRLAEAGYDYNDVQREVNIRLGVLSNNIRAKQNEKVFVSKKSSHELAMEVIDGVWGNGQARKDALEHAGYNYQEVQNEVNCILLG